MTKATGNTLTGIFTVPFDIVFPAKIIPACFQQQVFHINKEDRALIERPVCCKEK
ncbi:hypothetical protein ACNKHV_25635 [Shigella flexneri]